MQMSVWKVFISSVMAFICFFIIDVDCWNRFCSVYCRKDKCDNWQSNNCSQCVTPFSKNSSNLCDIASTTGYAYAGFSTDIGGNIGSDAPYPGTCTPSGGGATTWNYTYFGNKFGASSMTFSQADGSNLPPHYELRVIFWMILINDWQDGDTIKVSLDGGTPTTIARKTSVISKQNVCNGGNMQDYLRVDRSFKHNQSAPYDVLITTTNGNNQPWGVKQFIVLARLCNAACGSCYGGAISQCTSCVSIPVIYKLSGTTCNQSCLKGYGQTLLDNQCVLCDLKCVNCFQLADNCSKCQSSGIYQSFLFLDNSSCLKSCPIGYYGNTTDRTCYACHFSCISCKGVPTFCYECDTSIGYAWNNYACYNPCPATMFLTNSSSNCTSCSPYCQVCQGTPTNCSLCKSSGPYISYLLNSTCYKVCPTKYYQYVQIDPLTGVVNDLCLPCDLKCMDCMINSTFCLACEPTYYLYNYTCDTTCPTDYFTDEVTWTCLLCQIWCVKLTMKMYFSDASNLRIYVDMTFSEDLNYSSFPYQTFQNFQIDSDLFTLDMFEFSYVIINPRTYRIIMEPKGYIFMYNITIRCTTIQYPGFYHQAANGRPFNHNNYEVMRELIWFLIKSPALSDIQQQIIDSFSKMSDQMSEYTTKPYIQQIKKSGIFAFLFSGAQITSCSALINNIPSQNMYEGVRFWGMFVFFDVPPWERNSNKSKLAVIPPINEVVKDSRLLQQQRLLFDTYSIEWRFTRTGHTSFFVFDTYPVLALIGLSWILLIISYCLNKHKPLLFKKHVGKFYSFVHKVHEVALMYIMIGTILEWIYFDTNSIQRWISFGLCILVDIYVLMYELYIYHDMIKYPVARIGTQKYQYYAIRYGSLLKNLRYQEYDLKQSWSPKQWFRPYNYHILSFYKKLLMIVSLPLFYHTTHAQASVLILIQALQIARFCCVWPFRQIWRNLYRLILQCCLQMFFICVLIQGFMVQQIMKNNQQTLGYSIEIFFKFGWIGFVMVFVFNCGFIVLYIYDLVRGCRMTNREMMDQARRQYYYGKLTAYEQKNQDVPLGLVNKWVKLGNLNKRDYDQLPDVNIRVEYFRISKFGNGNYDIEMKKLLNLYMNIQFNFQKDNNITIGNKLNKRFTLSRSLSSQFYYLVDTLFKKYSRQNPDLQSIIIKTMLKVQQSLYKPGTKVELQKQRMTQRIVLDMHSGAKKTQNLSKLLDGFPVSYHDLKQIPQISKSQLTIDTIHNQPKRSIKNKKHEKLSDKMYKNISQQQEFD